MTATILPVAVATYPMRTFGDPVLRMSCASVTEIDGQLATLVADMIETMYDAPGVGLAAPQIGVARRVVVFDAGFGPTELINPVLVDILETGEQPPMDEYDPDELWLFDEGCLSVPGYFWPIERPAFAWAKGLDLDGNEVEYAGDDLLGRVLQHEVDHLDGILLLERLDRATRKQGLRDLRNDALEFG